MRSRVVAAREPESHTERARQRELEREPERATEILSDTFQLSLTFSDSRVPDSDWRVNKWLETELVFDCDEVAAEMHISLVR